MPDPACTIDDCAGPVKARGWCGKHYRRWERTGDPLGLLRRGVYSVCTIDGCGKPHSSRGWCVAHYARWIRHGDPLVSKHGGEHLATSGYMEVRQPDHVLAGTAGRVYVHRLVLFESIGYGPHLCRWCGKGISWRAEDFGNAVVADHLDFNKLNNDPANLVEACTACNTRRKPSICDNTGDCPSCEGTGDRPEAA